LYHCIARLSINASVLSLISAFYFSIAVNEADADEKNREDPIHVPPNDPFMERVQMHRVRDYSGY
jgi:hypothetical protein